VDVPTPPRPARLAHRSILQPQVLHVMHMQQILMKVVNNEERDKVVKQQQLLIFRSSIGLINFVRRILHMN
jgi:hypothetical protein